MNIIIPTNKYQTPVTQELLDSLPSEVSELLIECLTNIQFIKNLISPDRLYYKDLPRDNEGKAIVDITNPPILEDADYFRLPALHFLKHGCYTFLRPNSNPNSEYRKFWDEERRRCWEGLVRESDGAWISGFNYWFLNYLPMMVNKITDGRKKAVRIEAFPFILEGNIWRYYYLYNAREEGHHAIELAKRGAHPYFQKVYTPEGVKEWRDIKIGDTLYGTNGETTKVVDIPFDDLADTYKITLRDGREVYASDDHIWNVIRANSGRVMHLNTEYLYNHYISKRKKSWRIPSGKAYVYFIPKNLGIDFEYIQTPIDSYVLGILLGDWTFRNVGYKNLVIFTSAKRDIETYKKYSPYPIDKITSDNYTYAIRFNIQYLYDCNLYGCKSEDKFIPNVYKYNSREVRLDILKGLLDTDGTIHGNIPILNTASKRLAEDVVEIARSLGYNSSYIRREAGYKKEGIYKRCLDTFEVSIYGGKELFNLERKKVLIDESKVISRNSKTCITNIEYVGKYPCKCVTVDAKDSSYLIGDFIQTHNCAKSYSLAAIMGHNLILGESEESKRRVITVLTAYQKEYLSDSKDGTLAKFKPAINFSFDNTPFPHLMLKNSPNEMTWLMGYKDEYGIEKGSLNQVLAVSAKDDSEKLRGKRGWILFEEMGSFKGLLSLYDITRKSVEDGDYTFATMYLVGCVCAGTRVWTLDGRNINIEDLKQSDGIIGFTDSFSTNTIPNINLSRGITKEPIVSPIKIAKKECVSIILSNGNNLRCSIDHPILIQKLRTNHNRSIRYYEEVFKKAEDLSIGDRVIESRGVPIFGTDTLFDARLIGMLIGDGSYGLRQSPKYSSENKELLNYIKSNYDWSLSSTHITKKNKIYEDIRIKNICPKLREIGIYGLVKCQKRLPNNYLTLTKENTMLLLSGIYDTDGSIWFNKDGYISLTQSNKIILEQVLLLWRKFGVIGTIVETKPRISSNRKDKNPWYSLVISGRLNFEKAFEVLDLLVPHKRTKLLEIRNYYLDNPSKKEQKYPKDIVVHRVVSIESIGEKSVYNLTAGLSHTYLANNIVTHNTAAEDESDFSSAKTLLYSPEGYNIKSLPNVYDRPKLGKATFGYFFPSYVNRAGCYNKDGVSDVVKALIEILMQRYKAKYSSDPKSVLRIIAEDPITPAEAIIKVKSAFFPVASLTERLSLLDTDPHAFDDVYVGKLVLNNNNEVEFRPTNDEPIRKYGVDNSTPGAIEIFEIPLKSKQGTVYPNRYIIGLDPVDNDLAESSSLSSTIVLDLWTDKIVAEYTGRLAFADDNFEITRLLCLFYNARVLAESNKKGWYSYFSKMNCTHLLAETPEYLREKQLVKYSNFGSNKYGVNASAAINNYANGLIRDWLLKPVNTIIKNELNEEQEVTLPNLYFLRNRALIEELIAFNPEINVDRCVLENTQILTYNGIKNILDITLNDKVITSSGTYENVILLHKNNFYGKIYSVRALGDYRTLLCTDNHPILVRTGKKCLGTQWIKLKNNLSLPYYKRVDLITELDRVLIPIRQNLEKCTIPDDLLYILGWYIADGNISSGNYVKFFLQEDLYDIGINIVNILNKYFKRDKTFFPATVDKNGRYISSFYNSQGVQARITHSKDKYKEQIKKMWVVEIASKDAKLFFSYYGGTPKNKDINEELYNKAGLLPLIQGYFEGDGHYRCEFRCDGVERNTLEVNTIYEKLAHKIRLILLDNKLWCTIRYISNKNKKNSKPLFNISLTNECVIPIIQNSLKFKHNIPKNKKTIKTHYVLKEDGFWVKLKDIDFEQKNITTYNISVDNNPSYVASGIVTHNCRALGMVMLYREEKMILYQGNPSKAREEINASYLGNDPFFTDNYNKRFGINSVNLRKNTETC